MRARIKISIVLFYDVAMGIDQIYQKNQLFATVISNSQSKNTLKTNNKASMGKLVKVVNLIHATQNLSNKHPTPNGNTLSNSRMQIVYTHSKKN